MIFISNIPSDPAIVADVVSYIKVTVVAAVVVFIILVFATTNRG